MQEVMRCKDCKWFKNIFMAANSGYCESEKKTVDRFYRCKRAERTEDKPCEKS